MVSALIAAVIAQALAIVAIIVAFERREAKLLKQNKDLLDRFMAKSYTEFEIAKHVPRRPRTYAPLSDEELAKRERSEVRAQ